MTYANAMGNGCGLRSKHDGRDDTANMRVVIDLLERRIAKLGTQRAVAEAAGVSTSFVNDVLHGRRYPTGDLLHWLGFRHVVIYVPTDREMRLRMTPVKRRTRASRFV